MPVLYAKEEFALSDWADELETALTKQMTPSLLRQEGPQQELDLAPIKARVAAASKGPWVVAGYDREDGERWVVFDGGRGEDSSILQDQDAEFIADAREAIPALIAEIERKQARIEVLEGSIDYLRNLVDHPVRQEIKTTKL